MVTWATIIVHFAIGMSSFYCNFGYHPMSIPLAMPSEADKVPAVKAHQERLEKSWINTKDHLQCAKTQMKAQDDRHRRSGPQYSVGDQVWLAIKNLQLEDPRKLQPQYVGPFKVSIRWPSNSNSPRTTTFILCSTLLS